MKVGVLLSGGKDSLYAAYKARQYKYELSCCMTIISQNNESYMFHTPNIAGVKEQSEAMNIPLVTQITPGEKEIELHDLKKLLRKAKEKYGIEGITTGTIGSTYQATRIQKICYELGLHCFNPLWQMDQIELLDELVSNNFEIIITGVFGYPLEKKWLGRNLDKQCIHELTQLQKKYNINPAGEGGELESYVLDCPLFNKKIKIESANSNYDNYAGTYTITKTSFHQKKEQPLQAIKPLSDNTSTIVIISCVSLTLHEEEFIRPIIKAVGPCKVIPLATVNSPINASHVVISGCGILDDKFMEYKKSVQFIEAPILGICAGALLLTNHHTENLEIGIKKIHSKNENNLITNIREAYFLHHIGIQKNSSIEILLATEKGICAFQNKKTTNYGIQFHPEVSCPELLQRFINLTMSEPKH